ncbi:MAG: hypothetical protein ACW98D_01640 [Promethearchaeota archaeon]|jgi:hypothetical protein
MINKESINPNKNRVYFTLSKLSNAYLLLSGAMAVIGLFMAIYITNYDGPPGHIMSFSREWRLYWIFMDDLFFSMTIAGTIGTFISLPITIVLGIKLKSLRSAYLKEESDSNKDFILVKIPNTAQKSPRYYYYPY